MTSPVRSVPTGNSQPQASNPNLRTIVVFSCAGALPTGSLGQSGPFTFTGPDRIEKILMGCGSAGATNSAFELVLYEDDLDVTGTVLVTSSELVLSGRRSVFQPVSPLSFVDGNAIAVNTVTDGGHLSVTVQLLRP